MTLMADAIRKQATKLLSELPNPVKLVMFTQEMECPTCRDARSLTEEIAGLSDRLSVEVYNLMIDREKAEEYGVDKVPTVCIVGARDHGIRFHGIPAGYEFTSLMAGIKAVSEGDSGPGPATRQRLAGLNEPVDINVFVTLTCPYCPTVADLAQRFAIESEEILKAAGAAGGQAEPKPKD